MCVHCGGDDRAAASALGRVHLYMTGAHAAFEHPVSPLSPSLLSLTAHTHSKKRSRQLDAALTQTAPRSSPPFPTHSLSGANMQSISLAGFRRCRSASSKVLLLPSFLFFFFFSLSLSVCLLPLLTRLASGGEKRGGCETLEGARVWRGKSGHVGLGERWREKGKKERKKREGVQGFACRVA